VSEECLPNIGEPADDATFGRLRASFEWNQIPLLFSGSTVSLHTDALPGEPRIDDAMQRGIQNAQATLPEVAPATTRSTRAHRGRASVVLQCRPVSSDTSPISPEQPG